MLVTRMVAVTGCPAVSWTWLESGTPRLDTAGDSNETEPVKGSVRCVPSIGPMTVKVIVHSPGRGLAWLNCIVGPKPRKFASASN